MTIGKGIITVIDVNKIEFDKPASNWNEALPVGNGRLGGMVFGNPYIVGYKLLLQYLHCLNRKVNL